MLSAADKNETLKRLWAEMAGEEKKHTAFWIVVREIAEEYKLPHVFDDPAITRNELEQILEKVKILLKRWESNPNTKNALILVYRLEYVMLHPAFELLYHTLKPLTGETNPEDVYDRHIGRFIEMFVHYGKMTPELELLGETLKSLWERNKILTKLVMIDDLTGLLNRRGFLILAKELSYLAHRNKKNMGLLMIDIDKFKKINDTHGHQKGDEVLKGVATSLKASVRKSDIVGRFGGEEFIILFPTILSDALRRIAEMIRIGVENARPVGIPVTISIGVMQGIIKSDPDRELFSWIAKADESLYQAKANGRNCVVFDN
jgi:diguanylate cyclase (GGDEF)-like protein